MSAENIAVIIIAAVAVLALIEFRRKPRDIKRFDILWDRVDKLEADRERDREKVFSLKNQINLLQQLTNTMIGWIQLLKNELTLHNIPIPDEVPKDLSSIAKGASYVEAGKVAHLLEKHFSLEEIANLAFDLDIEFENLLGSSKAGKARGLIRALEQRGRMGDLLVKICELRNGIFEWC